MVKAGKMLGGITGGVFSMVFVSVLLFPATESLAAGDVFEVRATAVDSTLYRRGKIDRDKPGDEVTYLVKLPEKTVTRTAVYNKNLPKESGGGLQSDNTVYTVIHDAADPLLEGQRIIKAVGQTGSLDGYETVVIGEDFVTTSRSSADYFVLYTYKRTE